MLTADQARAIAAAFRPKFASPESFALSVQRYLDRIAGPARSAEGLERWLREDLEQDDVRTALLGSAQQSVQSENFPQNLPELVDDCPSCHGTRWLRRDVGPGHADFGKLLVCPACHGRPTDRPSVETATEPETRCWQCRRTRACSAGDACPNPGWHEPNRRTPTTVIPGWQSIGDALR